jgi:hypothetical protein
MKSSRSTEYAAPDYDCVRSIQHLGVLLVAQAILLPIGARLAVLSLPDDVRS